jgi:hypothetical protein
MAGQHHVPAALALRKQFALRIGWEAGWNSDRDWAVEKETSDAIVIRIPISRWYGLSPSYYRVADKSLVPRD